MVVEKKCLAVSACVSSLILLLAGVGCQQGDSSRTTAASISIPKSPSAGQSIGVFGFHGATVKEGADTMVTWFVERATGATNRKQFSGTEFTINDYEANRHLQCRCFFGFLVWLQQRWGVRPRCCS
jgi:hypothetical protein